MKHMYLYNKYAHILTDQHLQPCRTLFTAFSKHSIKILVSKLVQGFKKLTSVTTNMRQLRSSNSSYDQAYSTVTDLFSGLAVTTNPPKSAISNPAVAVSHAHKNQMIPFSLRAIWTANEVPSWHNTWLSELTVFVRKHWRAAACCEISKFAISSRWLKNGRVCHPDDIITLS